MRSRVAVLASFVACSAWAADSKIEFLCRQLKTAKDPRSRIQATAILGSTNDIDAIPCLCGALGDSAEIVRISGAKAMAQLADPSALDCLGKHLNDASKDVRDQVKHAYDLIDSQSTKSGFSAVYLTLFPISDKQTKPDPALAKLADDRLRAAFLAKGVQVAPAGQSRETTMSIIKSQHLKGYDLRPELRSVPPGGLQLQLLESTTRDGQLQGQVSATARGGKPPDLVRALAPRLADEASDDLHMER